MVTGVPDPQGVPHAGGEVGVGLKVCVAVRLGVAVIVGDRSGVAVTALRLVVEQPAGHSAAATSTIAANPTRRFTHGFYSKTKGRGAQRRAPRRRRTGD